MANPQFLLTFNNTSYLSTVNKYIISVSIQQYINTYRWRLLQPSSQIMIGTPNSGILYHLRDIYSICRCCWNVASYEWKVHNEKIEVISFVVRLRPRLGWPLWNICVTNDHRCVPLVANTSQSFPRSWLITGFVIRLTRRVSIVEQELLTRPEHLSKKSLKIPKGQSESVYRRTDNTMVKRKSAKGQATIYKTYT
jgi:hypothetical protein